jgi:3-hydroxyisobutyrate dehydrogenase-like beta-hydroxyacid dehydrogenase
VSDGAREAQSIADAVRDVAIVITMLTNDDAVRTVALGDLRSSIGDATVYVNCSTVSPALNTELAGAFPAQFVAMPVVGSPDAVRSGQAVYLTGGDRRVVNRLKPALESLSTTIHRYDTACLASTAKLTVNLLLLAEITALAESFAVGRCGGLSDDQLRELLDGCALVAPGIKNRFEAILTGPQDGWWTTVLGAKDIGMAINVARAGHVELPEAEAVKRLYDETAASGLGHADVAAVTELYRPPVASEAAAS